jgi:23S rRNA (guanosine2251-2'-O)-methyltransferase
MPDEKPKIKQRDRLIYGRHTVLDALQRQIVKRVYYFENLKGSRFFTELEEICMLKGVDLKPVTEEYLESRLGKSNHQGVLAEVTPFEYYSLESIIHIIKGSKPASILMLAHLEDPGNFGAILRSAAAFGISGVIIPNVRSVSVNATVSKTSAGTLGLVPVAKVANLRNALIELKEENMWAVGTASEAKDDLMDIDFPSRSVIVMGGESKGVPPLLLKECDFQVRIGISPDVESLNVSAATAIMLHRASLAMKS